MLYLVFELFILIFCLSKPKNKSVIFFLIKLNIYLTLKKLYLIFKTSANKPNATKEVKKKKSSIKQFGWH